MDDEEIEILGREMPPGIIDPNTRLLITASGEIHIPVYPPIDDRTPEFSFDHVEGRSDGKLGITDPRLVIEDRIFTEEEKPGAKTVVVFDLPYRLTGFDGTWDYSQGPIVSFGSSAKDAKLAAANLGFKVLGEINRVTIDPDNFGHCGKTTVNVIYDGHQPIKTLNDQKSLLGKSLYFVNLLIDWYCLVRKDYGKHRLALSDVSGYRTGHGLVFGEALYNMQTVYLATGALLTFEEPLKDATEHELELVKSRFRFDSHYRIASQIWVDAQRALYTDNDVLAVIQGALALEVALFHFLRSSFTAGRPPIVTLHTNQASQSERIDINRLTNSPKRISIDKALNRVLPQVLNIQGHTVPTYLSGCDRIREARNSAIHDTSAFQVLNVAEGLDDIKNLIELLEKNHIR